jgi:zinc transport system substrate-binding protein
MRFCLVILLMMVGMPSSFAKGLVVSTHPLYLIAKEVTKGVEQPQLLLSPQQTGHDLQLSPKGRQMIENADLVIWLGKQHEAPLQSLLAGKSKAIALLNSSIIKTLPLRNIKGQAIANSVDTHVWLEPNNAIRIAFLIAALRSQQQPQYQAKYWQNAHNFSNKLLATSHELAKNNRVSAYWAYHDAYQYVERALNLQFAGALTTDLEVAPTLSQIQYLNSTRPQKTMCLLAEAHANQDLTQRLAPVKSVAVDEAMANDNDFILGWSKLVAHIQQCGR